MADNKDLLSRLASRPDEPDKVSPEWNAPIDITQADCMTQREVLRGMAAVFKDEARRWDIAPIPDDWV
jgi:hypothetical protein